MIRNDQRWAGTLQTRSGWQEGEKGKGEGWLVAHIKGYKGSLAAGVVHVRVVELAVLEERILLQVVAEVAVTRSAPAALLRYLQQGSGQHRPR